MGADLHIHSTYSDGSYNPVDIIKMAKTQGISTIAIADHDTVEGIEKAIESGKKYDIEVIPALEFSTYWGKAEIHILGYYIDYKQKQLLKKIDEIFEARKERARGMISLLKKQGLKISLKEVQALAGDKYIGRPHIARSLVNNGYIEEIGQAFTDEFIGNGSKAYIPKFKLSPEEAINLIEIAGGIPVLAHPLFINHGQSLTEIDIKKLIKAGLAGVEVYHSKHESKDIQYYQKIAEKLGLLITGGSDFHGENSPDVKLGDIVLEDKYLNELRKYITQE
jgi:hypothetical protein